MASGAVDNYADGDVVWTHSTGVHTLTTGRLGFVAATSARPALQASGAALRVILGDGSANAGLFAAAFGINTDPSETGVVTGGEISDPSAAATNEGKIYFKDNGAGKTQACVRFNSGAVQCFATEP